MSEPDNVVLEYLRRFDARLARFEDGLRDVSARLASIESYFAVMHGDVARHGGQIEGLRTRRSTGSSAVSTSSAASKTHSSQKADRGLPRRSQRRP